MGRAHSTGDLSQQGLLPEVHCTACTKGVFTKTTKYQRPRALFCALEAYIAGDTLHHQPNGSRSRDYAPVTWAYGAPCPAMVSPNAGLHKEDKLCTRIITLYGARKVDSGPRTKKFRFPSHLVKMVR